MADSQSQARLSDREIVEEAFKGLVPGRQLPHGIRVTYSGKFGDYNANVRYGSRLGRQWMEFGLSSKWKGVSDEIRIGLVQSLLQKVLRVKRETINIDLYNKFLKNVHVSVARKEADPVLEASFHRVNEKFFYGMLDKPNLKWNSSGRLLGKYEYGSDTVTITKLLQGDYELLDYVMYHELLHKKHKFEARNGRTVHHSRKFRKDEKAYPNAGVLEARLKRAVAGSRLLGSAKSALRWKLY